MSCGRERLRRGEEGPQAVGAFQPSQRRDRRVLVRGLGSGEPTQERGPALSDPLGQGVEVLADCLGALGCEAFE